MSGYLSPRDRAAMLDEDGECTMCAAGEWPADAISCPVCDAEIPDDDPHYPCAKCGVDTPGGVLEDDLCPACVDEHEGLF